MSDVLPLMLDSELASEMVKLLGEELKKTRTRLYAAEEELESMRRDQECSTDRDCDERREGCCAVNLLPALHVLFALPGGMFTGREMAAHVASALQGLRDELQAERSRAARETDDQVMVRVRTKFERMLEEKEYIALEKQQLRKVVHAHEVDLNQKTETLTALQAELSAKDVELFACEEIAHERHLTISSLTETTVRLEKEIAELHEAAQTRDAQSSQKADALAALEKRLKKREDEAQSLKESEMNFEQALRRAETERDGARAAKNKVDNRLRARDKAYTNLAQERDKYKALSIKFEAEAKKADDLIKRYGWDGQYKSFAATMRDLPEPVDAPPPSRNKNGPCMTPGCSTPNSNITEIITQVYAPETILYLPDLPLSIPERQCSHWLAIVPIYTYTPNEGSRVTEWTLSPLRDGVVGTLRELFYRGKDGSVLYAGTYKVLKGPALRDIEASARARLGLPVEATNIFAEQSLGSFESNPGAFDLVEAQHAKGILPLGVIGLQCVGYKKGFDEPLRAWNVKNNPVPTPVGDTSACVSVKRRPELDSVAPLKRKCETVATVEKRVKTGVVPTVNMARKDEEGTVVKAAATPTAASGIKTVGKPGARQEVKTALVVKSASVRRV